MDISAGGASISASVSLVGHTSGATIVLRCSCLEEAIEISTSNGEFELEGLRPGRYFADIWGEQGRATCEASLAAGKRYELVEGLIRSELSPVHDGLRSPFNPYEKPRAEPLCHFLESGWMKKLYNEAEAEAEHERSATPPRVEP